MCYGCWEKAGKPTVANERVLKAVEAVKALYEVHGAGGGLHIVTDDWNCDDDSVKWCREWMEGKDYFKLFEAKPTDEEWECQKAFEALSEEERYSALAIECGFFKHGE